MPVASISFFCSSVFPLPDQFPTFHYRLHHSSFRCLRSAPRPPCQSPSHSPDIAFTEYTAASISSPSTFLHCKAGTGSFLTSLFCLRLLHQPWKMPEIRLGSHTLRSHGIKVARIHMHDWIILGLLVVIEVVLNIIQPFHRFVGQEMMTNLRYPLQENTVPIWTVPIIALLIPFAFILAYYYFRKDVYDLHHAMLGLLFSVLLTGVITDAIKDAVGRPRPDFFWRCFPDGKGVFDSVTGGVRCTGVSSIIKEGYKSFPSGHTSWSFAGLGFLAWYLSGKIRAFDRKGHVAKLCIVFIPLLVAALVGVSRVDDYWHHWQDVFAGGLLGITISSFCYLQFFPLPCDIDGWGPHAYFQMLAESRDSVRPSSSGTRNLNVRPTELQNVCSPPHHSVGFNTRDSSPMLDRLESGWGQCH